MRTQLSETNSFVASPLPQNFLNMKDVQSITGKSRSTLYRWINNGSFPEPINIGENSIAWPAESISAWRENTINQSNSKVRG